MWKSLVEIYINLKELEQYGKTFQKVSKLLFKFLKMGGGGYNKLKCLVKNRIFGY